MFNVVLFVVIYIVIASLWMAYEKPMKYLYILAIVLYSAFGVAYATKTLDPTAFTAASDNFFVAILCFLLMLGNKDK